MSQEPSPKSSPAVSPEYKTSVKLQVQSQDTATPAAPPKVRSISFAGPSTPAPPRFDRRSSIQFAPTTEKPDRATNIKLTGSAIPVLIKRGPRRHSPPPPSTYHPRVSFDTFSNPLVTDQVFTLTCKHNGYTYGRHQRVFLVAIDENAYSEHALKWLIEDMVEDGDEVICLRVVEPDPKTKEGATVAQMATYKEDTKELLRQIQKKNDAADKKAISIVMEFAVGSVEQTILHMINIYSPAFLTVGTRGKSLGGLQGLLPGSVSKWCMQNSPVPVVVVRHPDKRRKKMHKRQNDPNRKGYAAILNKSAALPGNEPTKTMEGGKIIEAEAGEAEAVAKALGLSSSLANRKNAGLKKNDDGVLSVRGGGLDPAVANDNIEQKREENSEDRSDDDDDEEEDEEDDDGGDESDDSNDESSTKVMYAESGTIEDMPNYVGEPDRDLDDDVERLALSDEEDRKPAKEEASGTNV